jgi:hypothetical protein
MIDLKDRRSSQVLSQCHSVFRNPHGAACIVSKVPDRTSSYSPLRGLEYLFRLQYASAVAVSHSPISSPSPPQQPWSRGHSSVDETEPRDVYSHAHPPSCAMPPVHLRNPHRPSGSVCLVLGPPPVVLHLCLPLDGPVCHPSALAVYRPLWCHASLVPHPR